MDHDVRNSEGTIPQGGEWWTTEDVCTYCHVTRKTVQRWRDAGRIQGYRAGRRWLYRPDDVRALVRPQGAE